MTPSAQAQESRSGLGRVGQLLKNFNGVSKLDGVRSPVYTCLSTRKRQRRRRTIPLSAWAPICHPLVDPVTVEVDAWFLDSWPFPDDKARQKFIAAEFSRVTCLYFPLAKNDSIAFACRLLAILFLIDDVLEYMSLEEGESYNEKLMPLARGNAQPNRKCLVSLNVGTVTVKPSVLCTRRLTLRLQGIVPAEAMFYDPWASMREKDRRLADQVLEPTFIFMRAKTEKIRTEITEIGRYLQYRERDVGKALLSTLMRFAMDVHLSDEEVAEMREVEMNSAKHISIVNDIYNWEKELKQSQIASEEGSILCSGVKVLADSTGFCIELAKTCLLLNA